MKKLIVIGASGSLAKYVIESLKELKDVQLTLFVRNKYKLSKSISENCTIVEGDAMNFSQLKEAIQGQDIVYVNLAGNLEIMSTHIVKAMQQTDVNRIIAISSIGIYETPLRSILIPYRKLADVIEDSGLIYTILRPDWFTNANEVDYIITQKGQPEIGTAVSRKSIATFISKIVQDPAMHENENMGISKPN